jgi:cytochrome c-type biogenesis protein CcmE
MTRKRARLYIVLLFVTCLGVATGLVLFAMKDNISYFRTPSEIVSKAYPEYASGHGFRLGGLVVKSSLQKSGDEVFFRVTDLKNDVAVHYHGLPPDLFREGQGVIAEGTMRADGVFQAKILLAKHDEKYMPPEVKAELRDSKQ